LVAVMIDSLRCFGLSANDFVVRISDRRAWHDFVTARKVAPERLGSFLEVIDKLERAPESDTRKRLEEFQIAPEEVREFMRNPVAEASELRALMDDLRARGLG